MTTNMQIPDHLKRNIILKKNGKCTLFIERNTSSVYRIAEFIYSLGVVFDQVYLEHITTNNRSEVFEILTYIMYTSKFHLETLSFPYFNDIRTNVHVGIVYNMINVSYLTHLDIFVPVLNDSIAKCFYGLCKAGNIKFFGVNADRIADKTNWSLMSDVLSLPNITGIGIYRNLFQHTNDVDMIFGFLNASMSKISHLKMELYRKYAIGLTHPPLEESIYTENQVFDAFLHFISKSTNLCKLELTNEDSCLNKMYGHPIYDKFFDIISRNTTITHLYFSGSYVNAFEMVEFLYDHNYTIIDLVMGNYERKKSIGLKKLQQKMHDFMKRNKHLSKKSKTLFQMMVDSVDLNEFNKKQRFQ